MRHLRALLGDTLLQAVGPVTAIGTSAVLARNLGPVGRGELALGMTMASLVIAVSNLGQAEALSSDLRSTNVDQKDRDRIVLVASLFVVAAVVSCAHLLSMSYAMAIASCAFVPALSLVGLRRARVLAAGYPRRLAWEKVLSSCLRAVALCLAAVVGALTPVFAAGVTQIALVAGALLALKFSRPKPLARERRISRSLVKDGLPVLGFSMLTALTLRADVVVLASIAGRDQLGLYAAVVGITEGVLAISAAFKGRMQASLYVGGDLHNFWSYFRVLATVGTIGAVSGVLLGPMFVTLLLGPKFHGAGVILAVMGFCAACQMLLDVGQGVLAVTGRSKDMLIAGVIGASSTALLIVPLVKAFDAVGAAVTSLIAYGLAALFVWIRLQRQLAQPLVSQA